MKGKKATQAANRRAKEAASSAEELRALLEQERAAHRQQVNALRAEVKQLKTDASRIAKAEVERTLKRIKEEQRKRGMSDDIAADLMYQKDKFVMNACRYLSMTKGEGPPTVFNLVMTWMLDRDFYGPLDRVDLLVKCGLPVDGWVAWQLKQYQHIRRHWVIQRRAREVRAGDIITRDPDHYGMPVRWRVAARPKVTGEGVAIIDYTDIEDVPTAGIAHFDALTLLAVEPVGGAS